VIPAAAEEVGQSYQPRGDQCGDHEESEQSLPSPGLEPAAIAQAVSPPAATATAAITKNARPVRELDS
jgi:hypothetical protein